MKKSWNWSLWIGFLCVLAGLFSFPFFVQFPITRDFPWVNLLLFAIGAVLLGVGLFRAFRHPTTHRGKVFGSILALLALAGFGLFAYGVFYLGHQLPVSTGAPKLGQRAPDFSLPDQNGKPVALADLTSAGHGAILIFYRGHW
jgi:drug/metabolite transporter (DMT)-like permease